MTASCLVESSGGSFSPAREGDAKLLNASTDAALQVAPRAQAYPKLERKQNSRLAIAQRLCDRLATAVAPTPGGQTARQHDVAAGVARTAGRDRVAHAQVVSSGFLFIGGGKTWSSVARSRLSRRRSNAARFSRTLRLASHLWNGDDPLLPHEPGKRHLGRRRVVADRNIFELAGADEFPLIQR